MARKYRPGMTDRVKLLVVLRQYGLTPADIEFDHCPPLALRAYDEATRKYTPDANDPAKIVARIKKAHRDKTNHPLGPHTSAGSDQHLIAKTRHGRDTKFQVNKPLLALPAVADPGRRCPRCGKPMDECRCPLPGPHSSFRNNTRNRTWRT